MRAVVLSEPERFEHVERERPTPAADEVLVAVREVGICGSDVHYYRHGRIGDYVVDEPLVLGHESAGEVVATGDGVDDLAAGDRVALEPGVPCGECERCRSGEYNLCPDVRFMATPPDDGAFAEYVAWPAEFAHRLPESVSTREGALCEPLSVCLHACRRAGVEPGDAVLVTGSGPIGLLTAEVARAAGAAEVIVADVVPEKLARAAERGADATVDASERAPADAVAEYTDGRGVDVVFEASGAPEAIAGTVDAVRRGGTVVLIGLSATDEVPIETNEIVDKELDVLGNFRFRNTYADAVDLLAADRVDVEGLVDFAAPLDELDEAFRRADAPDAIKGMISIGE